MTQPPDPIPLNYQTSFPMSPLRRATWILTFIHGILATLAGSCLGASSALAIANLASVPTADWSKIWPVALLMIGISLTPLILGPITIACSLKIRRRSRPATITALIITLLQFLAAAALTIVGVYSTAFQYKDQPPGVWIMLTLITITAIFLAFLSGLLRGTLRQTHPIIQPQESPP